MVGKQFYTAIRYRYCLLLPPPSSAEPAASPLHTSTGAFHFSNHCAKTEYIYDIYIRAVYTIHSIPSHIYSYTHSQDAKNHNLWKEIHYWFPLLICYYYIFSRERDSLRLLFLFHTQTHTHINTTLWKYNFVVLERSFNLIFVFGMRWTAFAIRWFSLFVSHTLFFLPLMLLLCSSSHIFFLFYYYFFWLILCKCDLYIYYVCIWAARI